ncbi:unnamed protein product [Colias eurytheme]|nr:unnamed protein product [Colias eurytheme]
MGGDARAVSVASRAPCPRGAARVLAVSRDLCNHPHGESAASEPLPPSPPSTPRLRPANSFRRDVRTLALPPVPHDKLKTSLDPYVLCQLSGDIIDAVSTGVRISADERVLYNGTVLDRARKNKSCEGPLREEFQMFWPLVDH